MSRPQGHSADGRIKATEESIDLIENRNRNPPAGRTVPQPTTLPIAPGLHVCM
jgi:hypothetical protein